MQAIADWIKHAFISKFNHINANVYDDFARVLRKDILNCHKDKVILDQTYAITKRVGLAQVRRDGTGRDTAPSCVWETCSWARFRYYLHLPLLRLICPSSILTAFLSLYKSFLP